MPNYPDRPPPWPAGSPKHRHNSNIGMIFELTVTLRLRGCRGWFVLVMGETPLSVRVHWVTAPEPLIYCQQIVDQPVCI